jgi:hypothetical protein
MELVDNLMITVVSKALEAGLGDLRLWLPLLGDNDLARTHEKRHARRLATHPREPFG